MKLIFSVILLNPVYSKIISVAFLLLFLSKCRKKHQKQELLFLYFQVIQGGTLSITINSHDGVYFPITFSSFAKVPGITLDRGCSDNTHTPTYTAEDVTLQSFTIFNAVPTNMSSNATWIAFGV